jgi:hypothetical protein
LSSRASATLDSFALRLATFPWRAQSPTTSAAVYPPTFTTTTLSNPHRRRNTVIMANYLASIFGTEQDKVNCSFYYKIGACRHGDRCSRKHVKPSYSQTILLPNLYQNPAYDPKNKMNAQQMQMHFDAFYEDIWCELCQYGLVEELVVCDNNNDRTYLPFLSRKRHVYVTKNALLTIWG